MLVDTHVALDLVWRSERTGPETQARAASDLVLVSSASTWELSIKAAKGRIRLPGDLSEKLSIAGFQPLPVLLEHTLRIGEVGELPHGDPFDRLLLTQALVEGVDFYTWDRAILAGGLPFVRDARL